MCHANNEKQETTHDGMNRTTKPRKNQKAQRKGNQQILGKIVSGHHQTTSAGERKIFKKTISRELGNYSKPNYIGKISSME